MDIMSDGTGEQVPKTRFFCEMIALITHNEYSTHKFVYYE